MRQPADSGTTAHSPDVAENTSTDSEKRFGSGTASVPCEPYTSNCGARVAYTSKHTETVDETPDSCWSSAATCVSTSTGSTVPAFGPVSMTRSRAERRATPATRATGPSKC